MSTELFDAKNLADEIHLAANVPEAKNEDIYNMTLAHLGSFVHSMDLDGMTMAEQRRRVGEKKDELIKALIKLREEGVLHGDGEEGRPRAKPRTVNAGAIRVQRAN